MSRRPALVTQADVKRVIAAAQAAGLTVHRILIRQDGVSVETVDSKDDTPSLVPELERRVIVL